MRNGRLALEIHSFAEMLDAGYNLQGATIQDIDFYGLEIDWQSLNLEGTVFLGCGLADDEVVRILKGGGFVFPRVTKLPFNPYRSYLYTWQELYQENEDGITSDLMIYQHFKEYKNSPPMLEALMQRIHDHGIDDALYDFLGTDAHGNHDKKIVGIMGGHGTLRSDPYYIKVAHIAYRLAKRGYMVVSGGGPGIMEAANLGAYLSLYDEVALDRTLKILGDSPHFTNHGFHEKAMEVLSLYPSGGESLAIPTWFYGHEPSNVFASHIAKYFSNSIREDTLLAICHCGIIYAPGSAGTTQEIFMDAAQNHYLTYNYSSPMILLGKDRYGRNTGLYETVRRLAKGKEYYDMIRLTDAIEDTVNAVIDLNPLK